MTLRPLSARGPLGVAMVALTAVIATTVGLAQSGPRTIGVDEIRPGMRGYGLSVLSGTTPERFDVEVIDVLHNFRPDQDLILVRTPHPLLNRARAVGGMSGSPVYLGIGDAEVAVVGEKGPNEVEVGVELVVESSGVGPAHGGPFSQEGVVSDSCHQFIVI